MAKKKPTRARSHELESLSYAKFLVASPSAWPVHKIDGSDDYGRDLLVEVFEHRHPTGNEFSVQLKAKEKIVGSPKVSLKLATLNHWEDQAYPTLIVVWDAATDILYYEWAHRLAWHDPRREAKTRTVHVPHVWGPGTPELLARDVDAFRKVRDLAAHFPVDVEVVGERFFGDDAGPVVATIIDALAPFPELAVTFAPPRVPFIRFEVIANGVLVSMSGTAVKSLTYGDEAQPPPEVVAGDALFALSFAVGSVGRSRDLGRALMEAAVRDSFMAMVAGRLADAVAILARADALESLQILLGRTLCIEGHPNWGEALAGLEDTKATMSNAARLSLAEQLETAANTAWRRPAKALRTAAWLVGPLDADKSLALWDAAVHADPATRRSATYWTERGGINFLSGRWQDSVDAYREADRLGHVRARPLLADALMWAGHYSESLAMFEKAGIPPGDEGAEWRLKRDALPFIVHTMGIREQRRDDFLAEMLWKQQREGPPSNEVIEQVLRSDALFGWAYWAACPGLREKGDEAVGPLLLAAVCLPAVAPILQELVTAALRTGHWGIAQDALLLARRTCGSEFIRMTHTDKVIDTDLRSLLLQLWGHLDDEAAFQQVLEDRWSAENVN